MTRKITPTSGHFKVTLCVVEFTEMPQDKLLHNRFYKGLRLQRSV